MYSIAIVAVTHYPVCPAYTRWVIIQMKLWLVLQLGNCAIKVARKKSLHYTLWPRCPQLHHYRRHFFWGNKLGLTGSSVCLAWDERNLNLKAERLCRGHHTHASMHTLVKMPRQHCYYIFKKYLTRPNYQTIICLVSPFSMRAMQPSTTEVMLLLGKCGFQSFPLWGCSV